MFDAEDIFHTTIFSHENVCIWMLMLNVVGEMCIITLPFRWVQTPLSSKYSHIYAKYIWQLNGVLLECGSFKKCFMNQIKTVRGCWQRTEWIDSDRPSNKMLNILEN